MSNSPTKNRTFSESSGSLDSARSETAAIVQACRQLHSAIDRLDEAAARLIDVTRNDLRCLNLLEHGPLAPKDIALQLNLTTGSVTALIDRLETKGLAVRKADPNDRRAISVSATPKVFKKLGTFYKSFAQQLILAVSGYDYEEKQAVTRHFGDATSACEYFLSTYSEN